jgi:Spy/CpxP family protein refolding chaperone
MKKYVTIIGILILAFISTLPVYAMGHGMGGGGMTGSWGSGLMDWLQRFQNRGDYSGSADRERKQIDGLDRKYDEESTTLKKQIQRKERDLEALLNATDPDIEKMRALHGEIRGLRAQLAEKQRTYDLEALRTNFGVPSENRNGWSSYAPSRRRDSRGMGYGRYMGDY